MTDKPESADCGGDDDVCVSDERDLNAVDAFNGFYLELAEANTRMAELKVASDDSEVTVMVLARVNLAWDLVDARLRFLIVSSRRGASLRMPALGVAHARLRAILEHGLDYQRRGGRAGELLEQARRLAERLHAFETAGTASGGGAASATAARSDGCRGRREERAKRAGVLRLRSRHALVRRRGARRRCE